MNFYKRIIILNWVLDIQFVFGLSISNRKREMIECILDVFDIEQSKLNLLNRLKDQFIGLSLREAKEMIDNVTKYVNSSDGYIRCELTIPYELAVSYIYSRLKSRKYKLKH
jgi:hypothetical protein